MLGDVGSAQGAGQAFAGEPDLLSRFLDLLAIAAHHEVDRGADLFRDALRRAQDGGGAGSSRTANARLAGVPGGVMFSIPPPSALPECSQRTTA